MSFIAGSPWLLFPVTHTPFPTWVLQRVGAMSLCSCYIYGPKLGASCMREGRSPWTRESAAPRCGKHHAHLEAQGAESRPSPCPNVLWSFGESLCLSAPRTSPAE